MSAISNPAEAPAVGAEPAARRRRSHGGSGRANAQRTAARLAAVQILYQIDLTGVAQSIALSDFARHHAEPDLDGLCWIAPDRDLMAAIVEGVTSQLALVDTVAGGCLAGYRLERLEVLLRAIIRAGIAEIMAGYPSHRGIIINDYVDIAHGFFAGREPAMVNGVLDRAGRELETALSAPLCDPTPGELQPAAGMTVKLSSGDDAIALRRSAGGSD